jgi:hypothetical protein
VEVGVADAAKGNVDLHVAGTWLAALDLDRLERPVGGIGAIGFGDAIRFGLLLR